MVTIPLFLQSQNIKRFLSYERMVIGESFER